MKNIPCLAYYVMKIPSRYWLYVIAWIKEFGFLFDVYTHNAGIDVEIDEPNGFWIF